MDDVQHVEARGYSVYRVTVPGKSEAVEVSADFATIEPAGVLAFYVKAAYSERRLIQAYAADQWLKITKA